MNHLSSVEQLYSDLVSLSPDFVHEEKKIKELLQAMITSKPQVQQDLHFKENLLQRLQQHIARKKNPTIVSSTMQSRIGRVARLIAYGLPGLTICFVIWFTRPMQEQIQKTEEIKEIEKIEKREEIEKVTLIDETISNQTEKSTNNAMKEKVSTVNSNTEHIITARKEKSKEFMPVFDSDSTTDGVVTESSLDIRSLQDTALDQSIQSEPMLMSKTASPSVDASIGPEVMGTTNFALPAVDDETLPGWQSLIAKVSSALGISLQVRSGQLLDCHRESKTLICDVLPNRALSSDHKTLLREEITKNLSADTVSDEQKEKVRRGLGL